MHPDCKMNKNLPDGAILIYTPLGFGCKTLTVGNEYVFQRVNNFCFSVINDKGRSQFYNDDNFSRNFKIKDMGKVYTVQRIQQTVAEMIHWQNVVYLPLNCSASIVSAKYLDDESKVEIKFIVNRNGSPEDKKLTFSESRFAEIMADFKYEDSIQTIKTEIMKPALKEKQVVVTDFEKSEPLKETTVFQDLYAHLFDTITRLKEGKITPDAAKSTAMVSQTVINLARLELEFKLNEIKSPKLISK